VQRVDVLRGPASVLYGEGATGAVVNVIPKKPFEGDIENHLRLGYGSYDRQQQAFDSGGSLSDTLSYRLNLNRLRSNGWIDRGDSSSDFISAALRWQATEDLAFTLAHDYGDQRPQNDFGTPLINGQLHDSLRNKNYNVRDDQQHYNDQWTRLTTDWQINDAVSASNELYYLKARRRWQNAENYNFDTAHATAQPQRLLRHRPPTGTGRRPPDLHLQALAVRPRQPDRDWRRLQPHPFPAQQQLAVQRCCPTVEPWICITRNRAISKARTATSSTAPPDRCQCSAKTAHN
jgi:outer membrane receptor protein involved in Fe transport